MKNISIIETCLIRFVLSLTFVVMEGGHIKPFTRTVFKDESSLYGHFSTESYVPAKYIWWIVVLVPTTIILLFYVIPRKKEDHKYADIKNALLCITLLFPLNGVLTNIIKLAVGRPRPDFFYRCWPDQGYPENIDAFKIHSDGIQDLNCYGDADTIIEGRKSFPSGHSSFSFATFGFVFFYISGKLNVFSASHKAIERNVLLALFSLLGKMNEQTINATNTQVIRSEHYAK